MPDEASGGEFEDQCARELGFEAEVTPIEGLVGVAEARLLDQPQAGYPEVVSVRLDQGREQIDRRPLAVLRFEWTQLELVGHPRETQLSQCGIELVDLHAASRSVLRSISSR